MQAVRPSERATRRPPRCHAVSKQVETRHQGTSAARRLSDKQLDASRAQEVHARTAAVKAPSQPRKLAPGKRHPFFPLSFFRLSSDQGLGLAGVPSVIACASAARSPLRMPLKSLSHLSVHTVSSTAAAAASDDRRSCWAAGRSRRKHSARTAADVHACNMASE